MPKLPKFPPEPPNPVAPLKLFHKLISNVKKGVKDAARETRELADEIAGKLKKEE